MAALQSSPRITPFLWFNADAEEAVDFYLSVFATGRRLSPRVTAGSSSGLDNNSRTVLFELEGQRLIALNGGPAFRFNEAISLSVSCESQDEIDAYWSKLSEGGSEGHCGWLKDRFGLSWQIVPARLSELIRQPKALEAMLRMKKLDLAELERASEL